MEIERHFELTLLYKAGNIGFDTTAHDMIMADNLVSLLSQFVILIAQLHQRILQEERSAANIKGTDDDIPF